MARYCAARSVILFCATTLLSAIPLTQYVDPFIATRGGLGFGGWGNAQRSPAAMAPFPLLRLGPDTTRVDPVLQEWYSKLNRHSGYFGSDNAIRAFSHTHLQGAGEADLGTFGMMVTRLTPAGAGARVARRPVLIQPVESWLDRSPFWSLFEKGSELASPGTYSVLLADAATRAEMTVSGPKAGIHVYTCAAGTPGSGAGPVLGPCGLALDVCHNNHNGGCPYGAVQVSPGSPLGADTITITAAVNSTGEFSASGVMFYLHAIVSAVQTMNASTAPVPVLPTASWLWQNYSMVAAGTQFFNVSSNSGSIGVLLPFPPPPNSDLGTTTITVRVGISFVDEAHAFANLAHEQAGGAPSGPWSSVDEARAAVDAQWEELLGGVQVQPVEGGEREREALRSHAHLMGLGQEQDGVSTEAARALASLLATPQGAALALQAGWLDMGPLSEQAEQYRQSQGSADALAALRSRAVAGAAAVDPDAALASIQLEGKRRREEVQRVEAAGSDLTVFYSMLYMTYCAPSSYSDYDGSYLGFDGNLHTVSWPGGTWVSDLSLWDTHRSQAPWLGLALPRPLQDTTASLLAMTSQGGHLPKWPFANLYTGTMVGTHGVEVMAQCVDAGACGFAGDNTTRVADIWPAVYAAVQGQDEVGGADSYATLGYAAYPASLASLSLDFAYDDYVASVLAARVGDVGNATLFGARAASYRATFCASDALFCPRFQNGTFLSLPVATQYAPYPFGDKLYTEGNAAQYRYMVPHNVSDLVSLFVPGDLAASQDAYAAYLQVLLANQTYWNDVVSTFLPNPWAWLGNEPSMLLPFQHAWAGPRHAWKAQYWPRWHLRTYYTPSADGIPGNDDYGTLSNWAVWAYLGLYPITATRTFVLSGPVWANATVSVPLDWLPGSPRGAGPLAPASYSPVLSIVAHNASSSNLFVACARANGQPLDAPFVTLDQLWPAAQGTSVPHQHGASAALLEFDMAHDPSDVWCGRQ